MGRLPIPKLSPAKFKSYLAGWQELASVILLFLVLAIAVGSIERAHWITPQPSLTVVLALAVAATLLLVKTRLPSAVTHFLLVALGAAVTMWQAAYLLPPLETMSKSSQLVTALQSCWQIVSRGKPSEGTIHFAVFLIILTWIIGYVSTWFMLRRRNAWVAVILGALIILVNLSNLGEKYYVFFFYYLLAAMFLVGQTSLAKHCYHFKKYSLSYPGRSMMYVMALVLCLSLVTVSIAWLTPEIRANQAKAMIKMPFKENIDTFFRNFLSEVTSEVTVEEPRLSSGGQRTLLFGDPANRTGTVYFVIASKRPFYWRTRMYNIYTSRGWTSGPTTGYTPRQVVPGGDTEKLSGRSQLTYRVVPKVMTDILPSAGQFVSSDTPASIETLAPLSFSINLLSSSGDDSLPPDVASLAQSLRTAQATTSILSLKELQPLLCFSTSLGQFLIGQLHQLLQVLLGKDIALDAVNDKSLHLILA